MKGREEKGTRINSEMETDVKKEEWNRVGGHTMRTREGGIWSGKKMEVKENKRTDVISKQNYKWPNYEYGYYTPAPNRLKWTDGLNQYWQECENYWQGQNTTPIQNEDQNHYWPEYITYSNHQTTGTIF